PLVLAIGAMAEDQVIREGAFAARTILAERTVTVTDPQATDQARRQAEESVEPVYMVDAAARAGIPADVSSVFESTASVREPQVDDDADEETTPGRPAPSEQRELLAELEPDLPSEVVAA